MGPQPGVDRHARRKLLLVLPISRQAGARGALSGKMVDPALQRWLGRRYAEGLLLRAGREPCRLISSVVDFSYVWRPGEFPLAGPCVSRNDTSRFFQPQTHRFVSSIGANTTL